MAFDTWDSYFYPELFVDERGVVYPPTLRNLRDIRDPRELMQTEYIETAARGAELAAGLGSIARTYDAAHLSDIHRYLFQDLYAWAGEYRAVNITKGNTDFAKVEDGSIDRRLRAAAAQIDSVDWSTLDRVDFVEHASAVFAELNAAHPFREGNGRTSKVFMEHIAERSRFEMNWAAVPPAVWNQRSELSGPDRATPWSPAAWDTHPEELHAVFNAIATDRPRAAPELSPELRELRASLSGSYPRPAQDAIKKPSTGRPVDGRPRAGYDGRGSTGRSR